VKFWEAFGHHVSAANAELTGYRLVGGQVLDVLEQLRQVAVPQAHAYIEVGRCLELFADTLVEPYLAHQPAPGLPNWVQNQALHLYRPIPPLVTAAKQEAIDPGGPRDIALPWILTGRAPNADREDTQVFYHYLAAVKAVMDHAEVFLSDLGEAKKARLYLAEATTNYDSARYLLDNNRDLPRAHKESLDDYLWTAFGYAVGAVQEGCIPGIYRDLDIDTVLESRHASASPVNGLQPQVFSQNIIDLAQAWDEASRHHEGEHHHHHHHHEEPSEHHHHRDRQDLW